MRKIVTLVVCLAVATLFAMLLFYLPALGAKPSSACKRRILRVRAGSVKRRPGSFHAQPGPITILHGRSGPLQRNGPSRKRSGADIQLQQLRELPCATCGGRFQPAG